MHTSSRGNPVQSFRTPFCFFGTLLFLMAIVCQPVAATGLEAPPGAIDGGGSSPAAAGAPTPNIPRGAQVMDQSAYAMGTMSWNVIFVQNDGSVGTRETWTGGEISALQTEISQAKTYWEGLTSGFHPGAQLSIDINYINGASPMTTPVEPTANRSESWVNDVMGTLGYNSSNRYTNVRNFNQAQRVSDNNHWATTIFAIDNTTYNYDSYAYAYFGGPFTILTRNAAGWGPQNFSMVLAHEFGHIFNARDEYQASGTRRTDRGGYLNGLTLNASLDGNGNPIAPLQANALMLNVGNFGSGVTFPPHSSASVNFGHRDTDADTIPDILDTFPSLTGNDSGSNATTGNFVFSGSVSVNDYNNSNPLNVGFSNSERDMTINTIASMSYILDAGSPVPFAANDGIYDDYTETLGFSIPGLAAGAHTIDVVGTNSVGNSSNLLQFAFTSAVPEPTMVALDIKPGPSNNTVALNGNGTLQMAIMANADFNVSEVDIDSLLFGDPILVDGGATPLGATSDKLRDLNHDGLDDLLVGFSISDLVDGGALDVSSVEGQLTGELFDGTPIFGSDIVRMVPQNNGGGGSLAIATVPEPGSCVLALAALCLAMSRRRIAAR